MTKDILRMIGEVEKTIDELEKAAVPEKAATESFHRANKLLDEAVEALDKAKFVLEEVG